MKILAAVDRSVFSDPVVDLTIAVGAAPGTRVLLVNVAPREPDVLGQQLKRKVITDPVPEELRDRRELLDRLADRFGQAGIACETLMVRGDPGPTIVREAGRWKANLVVVGSHGRGMLYRKFMGSVSEAVVAARRYPVLVVPVPAQKKG